MKKFVIVQENSQGSLMADNVAMTLCQLSPGVKLQIGQQTIIIHDEIPEGGSFNILPLVKDSELIAFGIPFGTVTKDIEAGHNIEYFCQDIISNTGIKTSLERSINNKAQWWNARSINFPDSFFGFFNYLLNGNPVVGVENNVVVIGMVDCVKAFCQNLAFLGKKKFLQNFSNVTDLFDLTPGSGCGMPAGAPRDELKKILVAIMNHPNVSHTLLVGLGCEQISVNSNITSEDLNYFRKNVIDFDQRVRIEVLQNYSDEVSGIENVTHQSLLPLLELANNRTRQEFPLSLLTIGVKCGGSDRFSAITSNRLIGEIADQIIRKQGSVIITETPEFEGVFELMAQRSTSLQLRDWVLNLEKRFEDISHSYPIPASGKQKIAPGNKKGGLINARLKSAGAMIKAGSSPLVGGLEYTDSVWAQFDHGLFLLNGPSYDPISTTALFLSGAQVVLFSTGRGTPISSALGPVIKLANRNSTGLIGHADFISESMLEEHNSLDQTIENFSKIFFSIVSGKSFTKAREKSELVSQMGGHPTHREFHLWKRWGDN